VLLIQLNERGQRYSGLLPNVGKLMRQHSISFRRPWCICAGCEDNVVADRVGQRTDCLGGFRSLTINVTAHRTEIAVEHWLELGARCRV
jgi:hypothetical protein